VLRTRESRRRVLLLPCMLIPALLGAHAETGFCHACAETWPYLLHYPDPKHSARASGTQLPYHRSPAVVGSQTCKQKHGWCSGLPPAAKMREWFGGVYETWPYLFRASSAITYERATPPPAAKSNSTTGTVPVKKSLTFPVSCWRGPRVSSSLNSSPSNLGVPLATSRIKHQVN
jgi:hypothetical protein